MISYYLFDSIFREKSPGKEGQEQINGSLPVNNVNKEFVYTTYDNETNLNVKNIDNISKNNNMQYNQDSSCVGDSRHDRYQDVPSHSKSTNQTHSLVYPSQSSQPVTPLHSVSVLFYIMFFLFSFLGSMMYLNYKYKFTRIFRQSDVKFEQQKKIKND